MWKSILKWLGKVIGQAAMEKVVEKLAKPAPEPVVDESKE